MSFNKEFWDKTMTDDTNVIKGPWKDRGQSVEERKKISDDMSFIDNLTVQESKSYFEKSRNHYLRSAEVKDISCSGPYTIVTYIGATSINIFDAEGGLVNGIDYNIAVDYFILLLK